jgi:hypothetical protein
MKILPRFRSEPGALAWIITLSFEPMRKLTDPPREDLIRLLAIDDFQATARIMEPAKSRR